jgi:hypothetical protein
VRISIAIFSYDGGLYFGVTGDYESSSDIDILTAGVEAAMGALLGVIGAAPPAEPDRPVQAPASASVREPASGRAPGSGQAPVEPDQPAP